MHPRGSILWLQDSGGTFPTYLFEGDSDASTAGWAAFTSTSRSEIVIAELLPNEWNAGASGLMNACERVNGELGRQDLRAIHLLRVEHAPITGGQSFGSFRRNYKPPQVIYSSLEGNGEAKALSEQRFEEFLAAGCRCQLHMPQPGRGGDA